MTAEAAETEVTPADLVLRGGAVHTFADWTPGGSPGVVEAIAVRGGRVAAIGDDRTVSAFVGPGTRVIDLEGRAVIPGINDTHLHVVCAASAAYGLGDVSPARIGSWEGLAQALTPDAIDDSGWIRAQGWDAGALGRAGTAADVDTALAARGLDGTPTVLFDRTGHQLLAGSAAMDALGIDGSVPDPPGGVIVRDADGRPTGVFTDAATGLVLRGMPAPGPKRLATLLRPLLSDLSAAGITSLTDPGIGPGGVTIFDGSATPHALTALAALARASALPVRTRVLLTFSGTGGESERTVREGLAGPLPRAFDDPSIDPDVLRIAGVKVFADGIQRSGTAWHREPYGPWHGRGQLAVAGTTDAERVDELGGILRAIADADLQAGVHATGDAASDAVVAALQALPAEQRSRLPYLIHGDFLPAEGMPALAASGIGWTANPVISRAVSGIGLDLLGPARQGGRQPLGSALRADVAVTLSSDAPVVSWDWREALITAVHRAQIDGRPRPGDPEAVSVVDAIAMLTVLPARLDGAAETKGRLRPGMHADLAVLDGALPDEDDVERMRTRTVDLTVMGGRVVFERAVRR